MHSEEIPHPKSRFLRLRCTDCGNEQVAFGNASSIVRCLVCGKTLIKPRGGKAEILTKIIGVLE
ncbi:MAG: 30S ribosomal protein S27e [Candidatus Hydrothermarchaeales archaeon]